MDNTKTQTNNDSFPCLVVGRSMYDAPACTLIPQYLNVSLVAACTVLRASMETRLGNTKSSSYNNNVDQQ